MSTTFSTGSARPSEKEIFGPLGITARTFHDPKGSKRVGLLVEITDMAAFQEFMQLRPPPRR
jgi:hypothetical protein